MSRNDCWVLTGEGYALERVVFDAVDENARPIAEVIRIVMLRFAMSFLMHQEPIRVLSPKKPKKRKIRVGAT